ncbi:MAG TPA: ABC transporter permease [Opitutus sp.]|nr:ABC transporter permease [Opitutus sp.]
MLSDLRFALRSLARHRTFTLVVTLTLALGIGSAASIFSVTDWILFRANAFPDDVFLVGGANDLSRSNPNRYDFMARAYMAQTGAMSEWAKAAYLSGNVVVEGQPVATSCLGVSPNLMPMLGITPALGRGFVAGEDVEGRNDVVIVTHQFWQQHLGGTPAALGRKLRVGDSLCTVVGVFREAQNFPPYLYSAVFRPLTYRVDPARPWNPSLLLFGRLQPGVTREVATQILSSARVDPPKQLRASLVNDHPVLSSMDELNQALHLQIYWVLLGAVGFLYAIACLNASNLMLVRMLGQRRELCIRLALGGGRWRIIRLLAVESFSLSLLASLAGVVVANWLFPLLLRAAGNPNSTPNWALWHLNPRVLVVLGLLTLATSLLIVIIPAFRVLRADIHSGLKDGGPALGESRTLARLRGLLVVLQAAFAVILLAGAGLMIRTFHRFQKIDLGFDPAGRIKVQIGFPPDAPSGSEVRLARLREIQTDLAHIPGVRAAGFGSDILLPGYYFASQSIAGPEGKPIRAAMVGFNVGYQNVAGIKLRRGQWLTQSTGNEILVSETLARTLWPNQDPIGRFLRPASSAYSPPPDWKGWLVVGVVGDVRSTMREAPGLFVYCPESWFAAGFNTFILRLARDFDPSFAGAIRRNLYSFDPDLVVYQIVPLAELRNSQLWIERLANSVLEVLAGIALALTIVGLFSVLAYTVDRRMGEFGVRVALGATRRDLVELVLRRGLMLTLVGVVLGAAAALALTRCLQSLLFETSAQDPWILAAVAVILVFTSILACALPAARATKVDVSRLLRSE